MRMTSSRHSSLDHIDLNILGMLYRNARVSKVQMSAEVGVSASRCHERMQRLEQSGIIRGYHADVDLARLASSLQFLVEIKLVDDMAARSRQFEKAVLKMPEVVSCRSVLGHIDYVIVVVAASIERYGEVIAELRAQAGGEFSFVTFPISRVIKASGHGDLRLIVERLTVGRASAANESTEGS